MKKKYTYKDSGINIDVANQAKKEMAGSIDVNDGRLLNKVGAFASLFNPDFKDYIDPILVLKTEEPGSKQLLAFQYDKIESVCFDMINHLINDCIVMGAKPLTIQDAIICGKLEKDIVLRIVKSISEACKNQECLLSGGETSEQPGVIDQGVYILTSSIVGVVERENIIDGSKIGTGDVILCAESSGLHTNGYTLIRNLLKDNPALQDEKVGGVSFIEAVLEPHRCYYTAIKDLFNQKIITGLAHITGGGIAENLNRVLPNHLDAEINLSSYQILDIFKFIKSYAKIDDAEMLHTFNMGVGMAIVVKKEEYKKIISHLQAKEINCFPIGRIVEGQSRVILKEKLLW